MIFEKKFHLYLIMAGFQTDVGKIKNRKFNTKFNCLYYICKGTNFKMNMNIY